MWSEKFTARGDAVKKDAAAGRAARYS